VLLPTAAASGSRNYTAAHGRESVVCAAQITAAFPIFAFCPRKIELRFTAAFSVFAFWPRKVELVFTAAFPAFAF